MIQKDFTASLPPSGGAGNAGLNLLFLFPVFPEKYHPSFIHTFWVDRFRQYFWPLLKADPALSFSAIMGRHVAAYWEEQYPDIFHALKTKLVLDGWSLQKEHDDFSIYNAANQMFSNELAVDVRRHITAQIEKEFSDQSFDFFIRFFTKADFIDDCFPNAIKGSFSEGGLTRPPFLISWKFDPCGFAGDSLPAHWAREKTKKEAWTSKQASAFLATYREKLETLLKENAPFSSTVQKLREKYKNLLLLPLQVSGRCTFDCLTPYQDQIAYLYDILVHVPKDTALIVTEHPSYPVIDEKIRAQIMHDFPFVYMDDAIRTVQNSSMYLLPYMDGMINVSSSLGWLALLLRKRLFVHGESEFSPFATSQKLEDLFSVPSSPCAFEPFLYGALTALWVPEKILMNPEEHLALLKKYKEAGSFKEVSPVNAPEALLASLDARSCAPQKKDKK